MAVAVARKLSSSTTSLLPKLAWKSLACLAETGRGSSRCLSLDAANAPGWILDIGRSNRHAAERKAVEAAESQILCRSRNGHTMHDEEAVANIAVKR